MNPIFQVTINLEAMNSTISESFEPNFCGLSCHVTSKPLIRFKRHEITNVVFEVNLQFDTTFSTLVVDLKSWETGIISVLPVRDEIIRDGIRV